MNENNLRLFKVMANFDIRSKSQIGGGGFRYRNGHLNINVLAVNVEFVIEKIKEHLDEKYKDEWFDLDIWSINHIGKVDIK